MADPEDKLLTGAQAAEFLGVKSATLYAYASRGQIVSMPSENARERSYRLSDLIRLRQSARGFKNAKDAEPVWTGPVVKSSITEIREDGHRYRGQSAIDLARAETPFGKVAELLWDTQVVYDSTWRQTKALSIPRPLRALSARDGNFLDVLKVLVSWLELQDPISRQLLSSEILDTARRLIVTMAIATGIGENQKYITDGPFPVAQTLLAGFSGKTSAEQAKAINCCLVLCADHELNASALAARVAASCDASLYSCLLSALGTFSGGLHGSASRRAEEIVTNSMQYKSTQAWLKDYLRNHPSIPGFGTELYEGGDPRARYLIEVASSISPKNKHLQRLLELVEAVREQLSEEPNLDVGLAAISYALALPAGSGSSIFAISRTAGWIAHAIEQRTYGAIIRPRAKYIGKV